MEICTKEDSSGCVTEFLKLEDLNASKVLQVATEQCLCFDCGPPSELCGRFFLFCFFNAGLFTQPQT